MAEWQPIETAPKDGTEILAAYVYHCDSNGKRTADYSIVRWQDRAWIALGDGQLAIESQGDTYTNYIRPFVTHWMPLPEPPKEQETN